ncbi:glutamine--fructose-6-phosphate transaminase (isomerizing) [Halorientalis salina]|uniref:glutamine--fructose-6-phosphate transaminase (isomerizing) n=1 Tax=Halorientalis salina TaxID=2932266 RepID=UPI0010ACC140|nr:glutamine--fructose-6-phosphate transaminase (isomerizing) [Halorientalis salina]
MCGIIAHLATDDAVNGLIEGLDRLEYRGYDSAGIAVSDGSDLSVYKRAGEISDLKSDLSAAPLTGKIGIGHTRWSTHGPPTDENAHPHTGDRERVAVVHNGVVENHRRLRKQLRADGHEFTSETDTEVIPHLIEEYLEAGDSPEMAFRRTVDDLEGGNAVAAVFEDEARIFASRDGSPLVVGIDDDEYYLASDVPAFLEHTSDVIYLEDGDVVIVEPDQLRILDPDGSSVKRSHETVDWDPEEAGKGAFNHYMLKEINEQPTSLTNTVRGRIDAEQEIVFEELDTGIFDGIEEVHFVGCGTSHHASLYSARLMSRAGICARAFRASEYVETSGPISEKTLVIAVTQSGETADTLAALREATNRGAPTLAVTNVMESTAAREADETVFIRAGPEIGVAATKTFTSQAVTLALLSQKIAGELPQATLREDLPELLEALARIPEDVQQVIDQNQAAELARDLLTYDAYFFIGRGSSLPVALEGALKFKEITYEHAEGFASGQLKHGPLALVTPNTPVFSLFTGEEIEKTITNAKEAQTRGADIIGIGSADSPGQSVSDAYLEIPATHPVCESLLANVQLQLISYHTADLLGRSIDKPRNLAKSVTVG